MGQLTVPLYEKVADVTARYPPPPPPAKVAGGVLPSTAWPPLPDSSAKRQSSWLVPVGAKLPPLTTTWSPKAAGAA